MKLEDITACKLYKSSPRKQQIFIKASSAIKTSKALNVQQPWQVDVPMHKSEKDDNISDVHKQPEYDTLDDESVDTNGNDASFAKPKVSNSHSRSSQAAFHDKQSESKLTRDSDSDDVTEDTAAESSAEDTSDSVESATQVTAACGTSLPRIDVTDDMRNQVESIKGTLNSQQLTCGVTRVAVKDDEVWCYYNDSVNLNEVMVEAIDLVSKAGYSYLEFNRLARSDNAIVFVIIKNDTARTLAPEQGVSTKQEE